VEITTTAPVRVLRSGTYQTQAEADRLRNQNKRPIVHSDGSLVRFAEFADPEGGPMFAMSLAQDCIDDALVEGDLVHLRMHIEVTEKAIATANGGAFIDRKPKLQLREARAAEGVAAKPKPVAAAA
jgi:hypothetical protein